MRITLTFIMAFILTACGAKELVVKNADNVITYQITKRVPLYSEQKDVLKKDVDNFLNSMKPDAQDMVPVIDEITLNENTSVESQYKKLEDFYKKVTDKFSALLASHMAKLDTKQQKDLFEKLDEENRQIKSRKKDKELEQIEERIEQIFGTITKKQKLLITEYEDYFHSRSGERLKRREKLHKELKDIYNSEQSAESKKTSIHEAFKKYQIEAMSGTKNLEILKKLVPTLTQSQKEHFRKHSQEIKELVKYYLQVQY